VGPLHVREELQRPALGAGVDSFRRVGGWIDVRCSTFSLATHRDPEVTVDETEEPLQYDHVYALTDEEAYRHADDDKPQVVEPFVPPPSSASSAASPGTRCEGSSRPSAG
jgi:hypothetical protein